MKLTVKRGEMKTGRIHFKINIMSDKYPGEK
jgi:hypothetical protein